MMQKLSRFYGWIFKKHVTVDMNNKENIGNEVELKYFIRLSVVVTRSPSLWKYLGKTVTIGLIPPNGTNSVTISLSSSSIGGC